MTIEPVTLAGHREVLVRDDGGRVSRHFVILCFASRWIAGEPALNEELAEARWLRPAELAGPQHHGRPRRDRRRGLRAHGSGGLIVRRVRALHATAARRICPPAMLGRAFAIAVVAITWRARRCARKASRADRRRSTAT